MFHVVQRCTENVSDALRFKLVTGHSSSGIFRKKANTYSQCAYAGRHLRRVDCGADIHALIGCLRDRGTGRVHLAVGCGTCQNTAVFLFEPIDGTDYSTASGDTFALVPEPMTGLGVLAGLVLIVVRHHILNQYPYQRIHRAFPTAS